MGGSMPMGGMPMGGVPVGGMSGPAGGAPNPWAAQTPPVNNTVIAPAKLEPPEARVGQEHPHSQLPLPVCTQRAAALCVVLTLPPLQLLRSKGRPLLSADKNASALADKVALRMF